MTPSSRFQVFPDAKWARASHSCGRTRVGRGHPFGDDGRVVGAIALTVEVVDERDQPH